MKTIQFPNEHLFPKLCEFIDEGKSVTVNLKGNSMRPFLESDRDQGILVKHNGIKKGDVVLAEIYQGHFVLHRIDKILYRGDEISGLCDMPDCDVVLRGDGNPIGTELCKLRNVRAICSKLVRDGKEYDLNTSNTWKMYSWTWTRLLPVRRYLLAFYKLFWRGELPQRWKKNK